MAQFESILEDLLSSEREKRVLAEGRFGQMLTFSVDEVLKELIGAIGSENAEVSVMSALLIRRKYAEGRLVHSVSVESAQRAKAQLLQFVNSGRNLKALKRVGDVLISFSLLQAWENELLGMMAVWSRAENFPIQELALYMFEEASNYPVLLEIIEKNSGAVGEILWNSLNSNHNDILSAAINTLCCILLPMSEQSLPVFSQCFSKAVELNTIWTQTTIGRITELTEKHPQIWEKNLAKLLEIVNKLVRTPQSELRIAALELCMALIKFGPGMANCQYFLQESVTLGFLLLAEPEKALDFESWCLDLSPQSDNAFTSGFCLLETLKNYIEESVPIIESLVVAHLQSSHWVHQNAGIISFSLVNSDDVTPILRFTEAAPRLQWSLLRCTGVMCMEGNVVKRQSNLILPLISFFLSHPLQKLKIQALDTLSLYCTCAIKENNLEILNFLAEISQKIYEILGDSLMLQQALSTLSLVITCTGPGFLPYSDKFYQGLHVFLNMVGNNEKDKTIRAECIRCIGCLVEIMENLHEANSLLVELLKIKNSLNEDDPELDAIWDVLPQFAGALQEGFLPCFAGLIEEIFFRIELDIDIHQVEHQEVLSPGYNEISLNVSGIGNRSIALNSLKLQAKIKASESIYNFFKVLKDKCSPWLQRTVATILPLIEFPYNAPLRKNIMKTLVIAMSIPQAEYLLIQTTLKFIESLSKYNSRRVIEVYNCVKYLSKIFSQFDTITVIGISTAQTLSNCLLVVLKNSAIRKNIHQVHISGLDTTLYMQEIQEAEKKIQIEDEIVCCVMEIIGSLLRSFKTSFQTLFLSSFDRFFREAFYKNSPTENEILNSLCMFCDYIECTGDVLAKDSGFAILEEFIRNSYHNNHQIRQTSAYGIGLYAQNAPELFNNYIAPATAALQFILNFSQAASNELLTSTESAAGALGKIALIYNSELIPTWLNWLPFKTDEKEARDTHNFFFTNLAKLQGFEGKIREKICEFKGINPLLLDETSQIILSKLGY